MNPPDPRRLLAAAQIERDWRAVEDQLARARAAEPTAGQPEAAMVALSLHHAYQAFESLLERFARALDLPVPAGPRSHQDLLDDASLELPGLRPALVPEAARSSWQDLLRFRHFLRHAYLVELSPLELLRNRESLARALTLTRESVREALDALRATPPLPGPTAE